MAASEGIICGDGARDHNLHYIYGGAQVLGWELQFKHCGRKIANWGSDMIACLFHPKNHSYS